MKITDCVIGVRDVILGIIICILLGIVSAILMQPLEVSAQSNTSVELSAGVNRVDASYDRKSLLLPDSAATLDLNGQDVTVSSILGNGAPLTITGRGSLTVTGVVRMTGTTLIFDPDPSAQIILQSGIFAPDGTIDVRGGTIHASGSYAYASTIRISGGDLTADMTRDALRTEDLFLLEDGRVTATGGTHALHAEGAVEITGGDLLLSGSGGAVYLKDAEQFALSRGIPVSAGRNADTAERTDVTGDTAGRYNYIAFGDGTGAAAQAQAGASASSGASASRAQTQPGTSASAGTSASRTQTGTGSSSGAGTSASRAQTQAGASASAGTSASRAQAGTSSSEAVFAATELSSPTGTRTQSGTGASAGTSMPLTSVDVAQGTASSGTGTSAGTSASSAAGGTSSATGNSASSPTGRSSSTAGSTSSAADNASSAATGGAASSAAGSTSSAGGSSSAVQSTPAANVTQVDAPVMGDNGELSFGITLLIISVCSLLILSGKAYFHETNKKRRP